MSRSRRVAVGVHACKEALKVRPQSVVELWIAERAIDKPALKEIQSLARKHSISVLKKSESKMSKEAASHQGVAVLIQETLDVSWECLEKEGSQLLVALDGITDPNNLGAIMRTTWLMGGRGLFISEMRSSPLTPAAHKVACGAAEHLFVDRDGPLNQKLKFLKDKGFWVFGLDMEGERKLWSQGAWPDKLVLVLGSEEKGLRSSTRKVCDELICLPQKESSASYNVSVAAGLAMSEYVRQQKNLKNI